MSRRFSHMSRLLMFLVSLWGSLPLLAQCDIVPRPLPFRIGRMAISDDGNFLLSPGFSRLTRYDVRTGEELHLGAPDIPVPRYDLADLDNDGDRIAFVALNPPGLYLYDIPSKTLTTLVSKPEIIFSPSFSGDGNRLFFYATIDFGQNQDRSLEVFRIDATGGSLIQITDNPFKGGVGAEFFPVGVNQDGTRAAFDSRFLEGSGTHASYWQEGVGLTQLTPDGFFGAELDDTGTQVVFISNVDLVPGQNTEGYNEVFLFNADNGSYRQLTKATRPPYRISPVDISGDGRFVTLASSGGYNGEGSGSFTANLYRIDTQTGEICTVAEQVVTEVYPRISNSGGSLFYGDADFNIFTTGAEVGVPALTDFGMFVLVGLMAVAGLGFLRKQ